MLFRWKQSREGKEGGKERKKKGKERKRKGKGLILAYCLFYLFSRSCED